MTLSSTETGSVFVGRRKAWIAAGWLLMAGVPVALTAAEPLTSVEQILKLPPMALEAEAPVRIEGVVVGRNLDQQRIFVQQGERGVLVLPPPGPTPPWGSRVSITGHTTRRFRAQVRAEELSVLEESVAVPAPRSVSVAELLTLPKQPGAWVSVSGFVHSARTNGLLATAAYLRNRLAIYLRQSNSLALAIAPLPVRPDVGQLAGARLSLRGVQATTAIVGSGAGVRVLWVDDWRDVRVERPGLPDPFAIPLTTVSNLLAAPLRPGEPRLFRLRGRVEQVEGRSFTLVDASGSVPAAQIVGRTVVAGEVIEVLASPVEKTEGRVLETGDLYWLALPRSLAEEKGAELDPSVFVRSVNSLVALWALPARQVEDGWPVLLSGRVTHVDPVNQSFHIQQGKLGSEVSWSGTNALPAIGDLVTVGGYALKGIRRPIVDGRSIRVHARGRPITPRRAAASGFVNGRHHGSLLFVSAVVRSVKPYDEGVAVLRVQWQDRFIRALLNLNGQDLPTGLVDAEVELTGVASALIRPTPEKPEEILLVNDPGRIQIRNPAPEEPFAAAAIPVAEVLEADWSDYRRRRRRVSGTVTLVDGDRLFVDDGTGGIAVRLDRAAELSLGDRVDVLGFPDPGPVSPVLNDATVRRVAGGQPPAPKDLPADQVLVSSAHGRLIRTRGVVVGHSLALRPRLELRGGGHTFAAVLPPDAPEDTVARWPLGSRLEIQGVCQYTAGPDGGLDSFRVLPSALGDIVLISGPSWWNFRNTMTVVGGLSLMALAAIGWAAFFRNRARQSRGQFLTTFHASPIPAWIVNPSTDCCLEANAAFERLFGEADNEPGIWPSPAERRHFLDRLAAAGPSPAIEGRLRSRDGHPVSVLLSAEVIEMDGQSCRLIMAYDITERLKLLEQLRQSQKMEAVGQLAAGVAHDFNNLLTVVRGNSGLITMNPDLDPDTRVLTQEIESASTRAADLTSQLLAFSRKSVMQTRVTDLNHLVRDSARMVGRLVGETIEVVQALSPDPLPVKVDPGMIDQVLLNLCVNARDAMPEGGRLTLATRRAELAATDPLPNPDAAPGRYAVIEVRDTGTGMTEEVREHAFDPFFTTKDVGKGTGLGLSTAYGILRQHGGWIDLDTAPGQGCAFTLYLPLTNAVPVGGGEVPVIDQTHCGTETILVVEDEEPVRQTVRRTLHHYGYTVLEARDGPDAESLWRREADRIDLVLTDLVMPNGLSGLELARRMRQSRPDVKIIYMTGHSQDLIDYGAQLKAGIDFLAKPFDNAYLARLIRERLDEARTGN